jgi:hypothetical protein
MATRRRTPLRKTVERGYGEPHRRKVKAEREQQWGRPCARCGYPMVKGQRLFLDHTDDRTGYLGWSHASCDIAASNRRRAAAARAQGLVKSRRRSRPSRAQAEPQAWVIYQRQHTRGW